MLILCYNLFVTINRNDGGNNMIKLNSITFKDETTGKIIEVTTDCKVIADNLTPDEYFICSFYAGLILGGGFSALMEYLNLQPK